MEQFWVAASAVGAPEVWIFTPMILLFLYLFVRKLRPDAFYRKPLKAFLLILIPSMIIVLGGTYLTKLTFPVERPCVVCVELEQPEGCNPYCEANASFPSGHAGAILTAFTALLFVLNRRKILNRRKRYLTIFIIPALVLASRVILGVHTMIDVVAGALLGIGVTAIIWSLARKRFRFDGAPL